MNTLVISVTERIPEIGTIRAIGAGKGFVRRMILWETLTLSVVAGLVGLLIGSVLLLVVNRVGIASSNMFFAILFGGSTLRPVLSMGSLVWSLLAAVAIGLVSSLYPASIALKIAPVKAMQKI